MDQLAVTSGAPASPTDTSDRRFVIYGQGSGLRLTYRARLRAAP